MWESDKKYKKKKKAPEVRTYPVPFALGQVEESISISTHNPTKTSKEQIINQAFKFHSEGNISEAAKLYKYFINQGFNDHRVFSNYGVILKKLGKLKEAESSLLKAIELNPNFAIAHSNLGNVLRDLGKLKGAKLSLQKAIQLNPECGEAHVNLGNILNDIGKLKEAEFSYLKAIEIKPDYAEAHSNLGSVLINLGRLDEAKISLLKAIEIEPNDFTAYMNLSIYFYLIKDKNSASKAIGNAHNINPNNKDIMLLSNMIKVLSLKRNRNLETENIRKSFFKDNSNLFVTYRPVEKALIQSLYNIKARDAKNIEKYQPVILGNTRGSDFNLFENNISIIDKLKESLIDILQNNLRSKVFIQDSFVTIFKSGGGVRTHNHITKFDDLMKLSHRKLSLVYYLSIGDQNCKEPGILKLYNPNNDILPTDGMIIIFPSDRFHSASYSGNKDRIIVGVNFYII